MEARYADTAYVSRLQSGYVLDDHDTYTCPTLSLAVRKLQNAHERPRPWRRSGGAFLQPVFNQLPGTMRPEESQTTGAACLNIQAVSGNFENARAAPADLTPATPPKFLGVGRGVNTTAGDA